MSTTHPAPSHPAAQKASSIAPTYGTPSNPWDLVVIGGGTAGLVGAKNAARFGANVLLVERERTGGDCLWTGCVPSKALIAAAQAASTARNAARLGVGVDNVTVDFAQVMNHVHGAIAHIAPVDSVESIEETGATVRSGSARFTGPETVEITDGSGRTDIQHFTQALIATGASPALPPIPGLAQTDALTSNTVWDLEELPEDLVVLGGGNIGCELGQAFARLGSRVTLVEGAERIMAREDKTAAELVGKALVADGAILRIGQGVVEVKPDQEGGPSGTLILEDDSEVPFGRLLVAVGRTPRTKNLGLDKAGVDLDKRGFVVTDDYLRTTNIRIWAAGDLTGHPQFTHTAGNHGSLASSNAVLGVRRKVDLSAIPRVTYTHPEVASVGVGTERPAEGLQILEWTHSHVDRAVAEGDTAGYARLVVDKRGHILGGTVVGPRAGETLGEVVLAVAKGMTTRDLAGVVHAYPTYNDGPWNAALIDVRSTLDAPRTAKALGKLVKARRWWVNRD